MDFQPFSASAGIPKAIRRSLVRFGEDRCTTVLSCRLMRGLLKALAKTEQTTSRVSVGKVMIQARTMSLATRQRTADARRAAPTPMIEPVMMCVVDTGIPSDVARNRVAAPPLSAQKLCTGVRRVMRVPRVRTMRQPPISVPSPMAAWHVSTSQNGTWNVAPSIPWENRSTAMIPMVFWASLSP
jgi:hypothetical protein